MTYPHAPVERRKKNMELKFRARDTMRNCYINSSEFGMGFTPVQGDDPHITKLNHRPYLIPEQYVGFNDKNGKEICVGDIVLIHMVLEIPCDFEKSYEKIEEDKIGTVVLNEGGFEYKNHLNPERLARHKEAFPESDTDEYYPLFFYTTGGNTIEIIGNIHDDFALLDEFLPALTGS